MDFEFETARTGLANAFAAAGAELLAYQPLVSTAVAAIPDTQPQKYAIAGTLPGILQMAGKMMGKEVAKVGCEGDDGLLRVHAESETCDVCARAAAEKPTGDLTDEWVNENLTGYFSYSGNQDNWMWACVEDIHNFARAVERAAIAAHLARKAQQADDGTSSLYAWLVKVSKCGLPSVERAAQVLKDYYEGFESAPASQEGAHAALDAAAQICDRLEAMMVQGGGELRPGERLSQAARMIRELKTPASAERSGDHG